MKNSKSIKQLTPQFFDLSQDIVEYVPSEIIENWLGTKRTSLNARKILKQNQVEGTLVSTDTSGLSKLSMQKDLIEVLAIINKPKELVYSYGKSIGGRAVGIWAADNTQMFYPSTIKIDTILSMLIDLQREIAKTCKVKIGIGVHTGKFYDVGNGMYGPESNFIENIAENFVEGGEIAVSEKSVGLIKNKNAFSFSERKDLVSEFGKVYRLNKGPKAKRLSKIDYNYPIPFSREFQNDIRELHESKGLKKLNQLREKYIKEKVIVLIERERFEAKSYETVILNDFSLYGIMSKIALKLLIDYEGKRIKTIDNLGIYAFSDPEEAMEFTEHFKFDLGGYNLRCKAGISKGEVIIFDLPSGKRDIAGSPINIISKIVQDNGQLDKIYLTEEIINEFKAEKSDLFKPISFEASGVKIKAYYK
jgi:hypothetical protein